MVEPDTLDDAADAITELAEAVALNEVLSPEEYHRALNVRDELREAAENTESDEFYIPESGERMRDPHSPHWGDGTVFVQYVKEDTTASDESICVDGRKTTVYHKNVKYGYSKDAPVVVAHYRGSDKPYHFPADRLKCLE